MSLQFREPSGHCARAAKILCKNKPPRCFLFLLFQWQHRILTGFSSPSRKPDLLKATVTGSCPHRQHSHPRRGLFATPNTLPEPGSWKTKHAANRKKSKGANLKAGGDGGCRDTTPGWGVGSCLFVSTMEGTRIPPNFRYWKTGGRRQRPLGR